MSQDQCQLLSDGIWSLPWSILTFLLPTLNVYSGWLLTVLYSWYVLSRRISRPLRNWTLHYSSPSFCPHCFDESWNSLSGNSYLKDSTWPMTFEMWVACHKNVPLKIWLLSYQKKHWWVSMTPTVNLKPRAFTGYTVKTVSYQKKEWRDPAWQFFFLYDNDKYLKRLVFAERTSSVDITAH